MSTTKIFVKAVVNGAQRLVELDRGHLNFQHLKAELGKKTQQRGQWYIKAGSKVINNDNDLKDAVVESEKRGDKFLSVDLVGGSAPPSRPSHTQAQARPAAQTQTQTQPQAQPYNVSATPASAPAAQPYHVAATPAPAPAVQTTGVIASVFVSADPNGAEKPRIANSQGDNSYTFTPVATKLATTIEVILATSKSLQFKMTSDGPNGRAQMTQTFNLPFDVSSKDISVDGRNIILSFPF